MTTPSPSPAPRGMFGRALLALALLVGFYALAIGIAAVLLLLPYLELRTTQRIHLQVAILAVVTAAAILIAIVPRPERFKPPGPRFDRERHPRLFALIDDVAKATGQARPREVYLVSQVNAWVVEWGGILGIGGRRVLGLGLPLFAGLTVRELRAVLAHEFGHFAGGDTRLGGIVHVTRSAIGRTLSNLKADEQRPSLLQRPFLAYGRMFLRVTLTVSREQERAADALAARLEGPAALASGLRKLAVLDAALERFLQNEINPAMASRRLPPFVDGFQRFLRGSMVREHYESALGRVDEESRRAADQRPEGLAGFDSHPPVHERIEALEASGGAGPADDAGLDASASGLVDDWPAIEMELLDGMNPGWKRPEPIAWENVAEEIYLAGQDETLKPVREEFEGKSVVDLGGPEAEALLRRVQHRWARESGGGRPKMDAVDFEMHGVNLMAVALQATLSHQGWSAHTEPGELIVLRSEGRECTPAQWLTERFDGRIDVAEWTRRCEAIGIASLPLTVRKVEDESRAEVAAAAPAEAPALAAS